ncbi:MAG: hypothetical protein WEA82_09875 [Idiomarina sp.]
MTTVILSISGCTSSKVYLNSYALETNDKNRVAKVLESKGFNVEVINLEFPRSVESSAIIVGSNAWLNEDVIEVRDTLVKLGFSSLDVQLITSGNHWYRGGNIGVYLRSKNSDVVTDADLAESYKSLECNTFRELILTENYRFSVVKDDGSVLNGVWSATNYPFLHLENDEPYVDFFYQAEVIAKIEAGKEIKVIRLKPLTTTATLESCILEQNTWS